MLHFLSLERFEDAIASYDEALQFKPDYHQAWYNRVMTLSNLERFEDAIAYNQEEFFSFWLDA